MGLGAVFLESEQSCSAPDQGGDKGMREWHPRAALCPSQRLTGHGKCFWITVPMSGGIRQVLLMVSGCSKGGDRAVGEHWAGQWPWGRVLL